MSDIEENLDAGAVATTGEIVGASDPISPPTDARLKRAATRKPSKAMKPVQAAPGEDEVLPNIAVPSVPPEEPRIGDTLPDGTIYLGKRADGWHVATISDVTPIRSTHPLSNWHVRSLMSRQDVDDHGREGWEIPDREEGRMLFTARHTEGLRDSFAEIEHSGAEQSVWLSEWQGKGAWVQRLDEGRQHPKHVRDETFVCLVRRFEQFGR